jgi:hypothetical protein
LHTLLDNEVQRLFKEDHAGGHARTDYEKEFSDEKIWGAEASAKKM